MKADIRIYGPTIKARAGEKVTLEISFDRPTNSSIHERRESNPYKRIHDQSNSKVHVCEVEVHEDTTDFIVSTCEKGRPRIYMDGSDNDGQVWCHVEVIKDEPEPEPVEDLGAFRYKVEILNDLHVCKENDGNTKDANDDWWDEEDFKAAMNIAANDKDVMSVMSCGDLIESLSPKKATPEDDSKDFISIYTNYWKKYGLRFFAPLGNHDFYGIFESRNGDRIMASRFTNYNSIDGSNQSVRNRIQSIWLDGQYVNAIPQGTCRMTFELENGKHTIQGQADMNFLAYNGYVSMYAQQAGYDGKLAPSENRLSDDAVAKTTKYVNDHWEQCKDKLSAWDTGEGMRSAYSKLNYFLRKDDVMFVFLSVDYGNDGWTVNDKWHDRMIHARTILNLNTDDPYILRMKEYVADTEFSLADVPYSYQYYSPNSLVWLKELIEGNQDKKIFVFMHHYLPNKVGNSVGIPQNGDWQYADISKDGVTTSDGTMNKGSNCLTGIEFWFINKLNNLYKNVVWFSGHSHLSWELPGHIDNRDYPIVSPSKGNQYVYTKASNQPVGNAAYSVALPSLSKPRNIVDNKSVRLYDDAEITMMEIYERGIKLKGYKIKKDKKDCYNPSNPLVEKTIILT